jgi:hypothetical protein
VPINSDVITTARLYADPAAVNRVAATTTQPSRLARSITRQRVVNQCLTNLEAADVSGALRTELLRLPRAQVAVSARQHSLARLRLVSSALGAVRVDFLVLRGLGTEALYPPGSKRDSNDIDILVPDENQFWRAYRALTESGLTIRGLPYFIRYCPSGITTAETVLERSSDGTSPPVEIVDLMAGRFPIMLHSYLDVDMFDHADTRTCDNVPFLTPSPPDTVMLIAAHGLSHGRFDFKDVNDLYVIFSSQRADVAACLQRAGRLGLGDALRCLLAGVKASYDGLPGLPDPPAAARLLHLARSLFADDIRFASHIAGWRLKYRHALAARGRIGQALGSTLHSAMIDALKRHPGLAPAVRSYRLPRLRSELNGGLLAPGCQLILDEVDPQVRTAAEEIAAAGGKAFPLTSTMSCVATRRGKVVLTPAGAFAAARWAAPGLAHIERLESLSTMRSAQSP